MPPDAARPAAGVLVAADHGVAAAGVSAYPSHVTARRVVSAREHTTPVAVLALATGVSLRVVDVAVDHSPDAPAPDSPLAPDPRYRVGAGTGRIDRTDALTEDETERAVDVGRALADDEVDAGARPAGARGDRRRCHHPGLGPGRRDHGGRAGRRRRARERDRRRGVDAQGGGDPRRPAPRRPYARDPLALLRVAGGADLAVLTGFLAQAAVAGRRCCSTASSPSPPRWSRTSWRPERATGGCSPSARPEPALTLAAEHLELPPLLDLHVRLDDGSGAVAAVPLLAMAARLLAETATAADSGIVPDARVGGATCAGCSWR